MTQPPHPLDQPFQDVDANAARQYALTAPIESTDTLLQLLEQAFLAGCAHARPATRPLAVRSRVDCRFEPEPARAPHPSEIPTHEDGIPLYPVYHRNGEMRCQKVAFYHRGPVNPTQRADLTRLRIHPSMRIPTPHDVPRCGSCGIVVDPYSTQDLDWAALLSTHPPAPSDPGADSLSGTPTKGRTPDVADPDPDVQPLDLPEQQPEQQHGDATRQISHLHALATSLFEERPGHPRGPE
jgi:hypothetical protein